MDRELKDGGEIVQRDELLVGDGIDLDRSAAFLRQERQRSLGWCLSGRSRQNEKRNDGRSSGEAAAGEDMKQ